VTVKSRPRVRIPPTPPEKSSKPQGFGDFCLFLDKNVQVLELQYLQIIA